MRKYCNIVEAEDGDDFQQYVYDNGTSVPFGEQVGVEVHAGDETELILFEGINFSSETNKN